MDTIWIYSGLMTVINGLLFLFLNSVNKKINSLKEELAMVEKDMIAMKLNYINRFDTAAKERFSMKEVLLAALNDLKFENEKSHSSILEVFRAEIRKQK